MKKKKIQWGQYIGIAAFTVMGGACGVLMVSFVDRSGAGPLALAGLFVGMYAAMMLQIAIHEAGHLVFGLASGYKFRSYRIFSLMWVHDGERIRLRRFSLAGTGGQCLMEPPDLVNGEIPVVLYNLGGSLMNILAGLLFLLLSLPGSGFLSAFFQIAALIGFVFALMNGIPLRMGSVDTTSRPAA